jgi:HK97 family phage portal protein
MGAMPQPSWLSRLILRAAKYAGVAVSSDDVASSFFGGVSASSAGYTITEESALRIRVVMSCVRLISQDIAKCPIDIVDVRGGSVVERNDHPLWYLLNVEPNPEMSAVTMREALVANQQLTGLGLARIVRSATTGRPLELWPIHWRQVTKQRRNGVDGPIQYRITHDSGKSETLAQEDVFELPGLSLDGINMLSPVRYLAESLGLAAAVTEASGSGIGSMINPSGILKWTIKPDPKTQAQVEETIEREYVGAKKRRVLSLKPGMELEAFKGMSHDDAQLIELFKFSESALANAFGVPPHMVGIMDGAKYSNVEHGRIEYYQGALAPVQTKFETECSRKLFSQKEQTLRAQINEQELLRGDWKSQMEAIASGRQWGIYTANQACRKLGEPLHGAEGDVLHIPINMQAARVLVDQERPAWDKEDTSQAAPVGGAQPARAMVPVVADIAERLRKVETDRLARAKTDADREAFWATHAEHVRAALFPVAEAVAMMSGRNAGQVAAAMTRAYVANAKEAGSDAASVAAEVIEAAEGVAA